MALDHHDRPLLRMVVVDAGPVARVALSKTEAAAALGVSPDYFHEHIAPELRLVRRGRRQLVPVAELLRWLEENAALTLDGLRRNA
jgi:hypothetical protein